MGYAAPGLEHPRLDDQQPTAPAYKWRLLLAYDGTRFSGWQYQPSPPTLQCTLEQALTRVTKLERKDLCVVGASRTDTGVHALGQVCICTRSSVLRNNQPLKLGLAFQVAHFVTPFGYEGLQDMHAALNGLLPPDIRVREISPAVPEFHARFSVTGKIYHYKIYNDTIMDPFLRLYAYHNLSKLNTRVMKEAARYFVGKHDFSAFANAQRNDRAVNPVKYVSRVDITEEGPVLQVEVEGSGFLYRQVRNMVALLLQIGREAIPADIVPKILATRDRRELAKVALVAPSHGLCLVQVKYNEEHLRLPEDGPASSFGRHHSITKCKLQYY